VEKISLPLTEKQKDALLIGGLGIAGIIAGIAVARATAKVTISRKCLVNSDCPAGYVCKYGVCVIAPPPPPCVVDSDCPAGYVCKSGVCQPTVEVGIPFKVTPLSYSSSISQNLAFYATGSPGNICLQCDAYISANDTVTNWGWEAYDATFQVVDAAGRGVPNITMQVWPLQSRDDQGGILYIDGEEITAGKPIKVVTDSNGVFSIFLEYRQTDAAVNILKNKSNIGCCVDLLGKRVWAGPISYPNGCCGIILWPYSLPTVPCWKDSQTASSDLKLYTIHAEMVGAPAIFTEISLSAKFQSKCFW
jgi:Cys-rich repeat protein